MSVFFAVPYSIFSQFSPVLRLLIASVQNLGRTSVLSLRTQEVPACLASSPSDHYFSNILQIIHQEVGLTEIRPVVSLYQSHWFAVSPLLPDTPLYFLPSSIVSDPSELPLIYHELGHTFFNLWGDEFFQYLGSVLKTTFRRKEREIEALSDPLLRADTLHLLDEIKIKMEFELEELACDIVGTLLGGHAFVAALSIGLFTSLNNPFDYDSPLYPPLDCRMRIGKITLGLLGLKSDIIDYFVSNWANVQALYTPQRWYKWIYDDQYLTDLGIATRDFLITKNIVLYKETSGGIRQELNEGLPLMVNQASLHQEWIYAQKMRFTNVYSSPNSSS